MTHLNETLSYTGDGLLAAHTIARPDFTDARSYAYASLSRRLAQEMVRVNSSTLWTNAFTYDAGAAGGLGVLTRAGQSAPTGTAWKGGTDALSLVNGETNSVARRSANGRVNGIATVSALLDGQPMPVTILATSDHVWTNQWRTTLEMTPGPHQLVATALHPSGLYTTNATVNYTNNAADTVQDVYSADGALTQRVWKKSDGTTNRTQTLSWDAKAASSK